MIDRTAEQFDLKPARLVGDACYGSGEMVVWLVDERGIEPHVKLVDKSERTDGTFPVYNLERDLYECPGGKESRKYLRNFSKPRDGVLKDGRVGDRAIQRDCNACALKPKCWPNMPARKIERSIHEAARDKVRAITKTEAYAVSGRERKKVEMRQIAIQSAPGHSWLCGQDCRAGQEGKGETAMVRSRVLLSAIFATLGVALAGCAATPLYPGYYADSSGPGAYYCGDVGAWDVGAWGGRRNCVRAGY